MRKKIPPPLLFLILCLSLLTACAASVFTGAEKLDTANGVFTASAQLIILHIRLPRTILAVLCGALLAGSGAVFQGFFRNSLADPAIIGVSSGATAGTAAAYILFSSVILLPAAAFAGSMAAVTAVYFISGAGKKAQQPITLLLAGNIIGIMLSACTSLMIIGRDKNIQKIYMWSLGSLSGRGWADVAMISAPAVFSFVMMMMCARPLDILASGEQTAQSLGLSLRKTRVLCLTAGSLASAAAAAAAGTIGFIGLASAHIIRLIIRTENRIVIPASMMLGSILLVCSDTAARTAAAPMEIPVGIITALLGAPLFLHILMRTASGKRNEL